MPKNNSGIEAVIFDFDGTLAELILDFGDMRRQVADLAGQSLGEPPEPAEEPVLEWVTTLAQRIEAAGGDAAGFRERAARRIEAMEIEAAGRGTLFPFARDVLDELAGRGLGAAIVTRNCRRAVELVFPDARRHVKAVLAREDVPRVKPHPDHLLAALAALGVEPQRALMVGDHPLDIEAGKRAGTKTAGVASGRVPLEVLGRFGPDHLAAHAGELVRALFPGEAP